MATGGSGSSLLPDMADASPRGGPVPSGRGGAAPADAALADAELMEFAAGLYVAPAPPDQASTTTATATKEGSARSKKIAKKSSRSILAEAFENTAIGSGSLSGT